MTAVVQRRQQAAIIAALGSSAQEVVVSCWHNRSFEHLDRTLPGLADDLLLSAERHLSYPVLHDFHAAERRDEFTIQLLVLDEAVSILEHAVDPTVARHPKTLARTRVAVVNPWPRRRCRHGGRGILLTDGGAAHRPGPGQYRSTGSPHERADRVTPRS